MALSASTVWEVRTGGSDDNGGAFVTGASGTDRSLQDAAHATLTTLSTIHTTTTQINVSVADFTVSAADVGNILQITGGSATAGFYQITAADVGNNRWTVDRSAGTAAQTVVGAMGGALATPGKASGVATVSGNVVFLKYNATPYSITSASSNVSNGVLSFSTGVSIFGYDSTRTITNTDSNRPTVQLNVSTATMFTGSSNATIVSNIIADGNTQTAAKFSGGSMLAYRVHIINFNTASSSYQAVLCSATTNSAAVFIDRAMYCEAYANTATPFSTTSNTVFVGNISRSNTGASTDGYSVASSGNAWVSNNASYANGRDGFRTTDALRYFSISNNVAVGNGGFGFSYVSNRLLFAINNATFNNTSGAVSGTVTQIGAVTLSGDPFTDAGAGNLALNNTAGAGAALRAAGFPATFPAGLTANFLDIGAAQHQDAGGGGLLVNPGMSGGIRG